MLLKNSCLTHLGGKRYALDVSVGALWMDEGGIVKALDPTLDATMVPRCVPYDVTPYLMGKPGFHYRSRRSGEFSVRIRDAISDGAVVAPLRKHEPVVLGRDIVWAEYYPGVDVVLRYGVTGVSLQRVIKNQDAPRTYDIDIVSVPGEAVLRPVGPAHDADGDQLEVAEKPISGGRTETLLVPGKVIWPVRDATEVDEQVGASADDGTEVVSTGNTDIISTTIGFGSYSINRHCGIRFQSVNIPKDATIDTAYLLFYAYYTDSGAVLYTWYGEDIDNAPAFEAGSGNHNISSRDRTTASVVENPPEAWTGATWEPSTPVEIKSLIAEITSRAGWSANNNLVLLCIYGSGTGERVAASWDYSDHSYAPKLHVEYTAGAATVDGEASGSGAGTGTSSGSAEVAAQATASGIGSGSSTGNVIIDGEASGVGTGTGTSSCEGIVQGSGHGQGAGSATVGAILDVIGGVAGGGAGLGTTEALVHVLGVAAANGEGLGLAEAMLELVAEATGHGIGSGTATGTTSEDIISGTASGSGAGNMSLDTTQILRYVLLRVKPSNLKPQRLSTSGIETRRQYIVGS